jgi:hypothetical protein
MTPNEPDSHPPANPEVKSYSTRRDFLLQIGVVLNTIAGFMIGLPIVGFILSSLIKKTPRVWFSLGAVSQFPEGAMRLAVYENPYRREADGQTARLTCWVRRIQGDQFKEELFTPMVDTLRALRPGAFTCTSIRLRKANCRSRPVFCPPWRARRKIYECEGQTDHQHPD